MTMNKTAGKARSRKNKFIHKVLGTDDKRKLIKLVGGTSFDLFIMGIILADAIVLGLMTSEVMSMVFARPFVYGYFHRRDVFEDLCSRASFL